MSIQNAFKKQYKMKNGRRAERPYKIAVNGGKE